MRASRPTATSARRWSTTWRSTGMPTSAPPDARVESMPRDELRTLQLERLRTTVTRVLTGQPAGAAQLKAAGVLSAEDLTSLQDLGAVPFIAKAALREHYPFGLLAVPRSELVRLHASSGTHGKPTVVGYTRS